MTWLGLALVLLPESFVSAAEGKCASNVVMVDADRIDLAPPTGFVEICSQDAKLCEVLTRGYPPSAETIGYFVTATEWARHKKQKVGFTRYLIAQVSRSTAAKDFPGLKDFIRARQGKLPDHTDLPKTLKSQGQVSLGIVDEAPDSISFGTIMKTRTTEPPERTLVQVALNSALVIGPRVLSLYTFRDFQTAKDVEAAKQLTRNWLQCLRSANPKGG